MTTFEALKGATRRGARLVPVQWAPATQTSAATRIMTWVFGGIAGLGLWLVLFGTVLSGLTEAHAQHGLYEKFRTELAAATAPLGGVIPEGDPVAMIDAPAGGINGLVVVEGTTSTDLREGPGHLPGTPLPGQSGFVQIYGRSTTYGAPFGDLADFAPGDAIKVTTGQGVFTYSVQDVRRPGDPVPPALAVGGSRLILASTIGPGWRSGLAPTQPIYVDALLQGKPAAAPVGSVAAQIPADALMKSDGSGLFPLILWLQLLLVSLIAAAWATVRWGRWQTWIVVLPVALAALWGASSSLWTMLPNVL